MIKLCSITRRYTCKPLVPGLSRYPRLAPSIASCGSGQAMLSFRMGVVQVMKVWLRTERTTRNGDLMGFYWDFNGIYNGI